MGKWPLQRRIPKSGFRSAKALLREELRLSDFNKFNGEVVTLETLKENGLIRVNTQTVKIIASGELTKPLVIKGVAVTAGAKKAIETAGGKVEA